MPIAPFLVLTCSLFSAVLIGSIFAVLSQIAKVWILLAPSSISDPPLPPPPTAGIMCSWNLFRTLCDHSIKLFVALELTADLPDQAVIDRWLGEPVKVWEWEFCIYVHRFQDCL